MRNTTALSTIIRGTAAPAWSVQPWQQHFAKDDSDDDKGQNEDDGDDDGEEEDPDDDADDDAKAKSKKKGDKDSDDDSGDELAVWKRNSRKHEKNFKASAAQLSQVKKILGIKDGDKLDPDQVEEALNNTKSENAQLKLELRVTKFAGDHADDLLDSKRFTDQVKNLDADSDSYDKDLKKVIEAELKARNLGTKRRPGTSGKPIEGEPSKGQLTRDDLKKMSPKEIEKARREGRLNDVLAGKSS